MSNAHEPREDCNGERVWNVTELSTHPTYSDGACWCEQEKLINRHYGRAVSVESSPIYDNMVKDLVIPDDLVPKMARTIGYFALGADVVLSPMIIGITQILNPAAADIVTPIVSVVGVGIAAYAALMGIMYRPTRKGL